MRVTQFSKIRYDTKIQDPTVRGVTVIPTSDVRMLASSVLLMLGN